MWTTHELGIYCVLSWSICLLLLLYNVHANERGVDDDKILPATCALVVAAIMNDLIIQFIVKLRIRLFLIFHETSIAAVVAGFWLSACAIAPHYYLITFILNGNYYLFKQIS